MARAVRILRVAPGNNLIRGFDDVLPDYFDCLVTLRRKVLLGFPIEKCHRLVQAIPLGNGDVLRRVAPECNNLSINGAQITTAGRLLRVRNERPKNF